jgi:hypothetical protein
MTESSVRAAKTLSYICMELAQPNGCLKKHGYYGTTFGRGTGSNQRYKPMTPTGNIRIWWDTSVLAYRMASPYNQDLVNAVKQHIPVSDRSYDPTTKIWTFVERQLEPLRKMLTLIGLQYVVITKQMADQVASQQSAGAGASRANVKPLDAVIIEFVRLLPLDAAKAAYRKAAMDLHPDKQGGNSSKMTALNTAWDRIQKEVYNA